MADETENLPLGQLVEEQLTILQSDNVTQDQINIAFFRMRQYKPLRDVLEARKDEIAIKLANPDEIKKLFIDLLSNEQRIIREGVKHPVELDNPLSPAEVAARAELFAKARQEIPKATEQRFELERKNYARKVTDAWVAELRNRRLYNVTPEEERIITQSVENLPPTASAEETKNLVVGQLQTLAQTNPNLSRNQAVLQQIAQTTDLPEPAQIQQEIAKTVLDYPDIAQPTLVTLLGQGVEASRAASLTRVAVGLSLDINPAIDVTRPSVFFQAVATTGLQKLAAPAADAILTVLPQGTREQIIESVLTKSWERVTKNLDEKFGATVVSSPLFKEALAHGNRAFEKPTAPGGAAAGASRLIGDVFGSVFGSGIDQKMINEYLELGKRTPLNVPATMTFLQFYTAFGMGYKPELFHAAFTSGRWILDWVGTGAKQVGGMVVKKGIGKLVGGFLGTLGGGPIGAFIGSFVGDKILGGISKAFGFVAGLFGGFFGKGGGEEKPWYQNWEILFPLLIVAVPVGMAFLMILSNPVPSALVNMGGGNEEAGGSSYIKVTKSPSPSSYPDNNPGTVTYTITIQATAANLSNIKVADSFSVFGGSANITAPPVSGAPSSLADGENFSTTIAVSLTGLKDSLVTNTITVTADAKTINGETKTGEQRSATASVIIGKPPTGCFEFPDDPTPDPDMGGRRSDPWDDKSAVLSAVATLARSTSYMAQLCSGGRPIYLHRVRVNAVSNGATYGGAVTSANDIFLYNAGTRGLSALYTLSHESGHILAQRTKLFAQFHNEGISVREGFLWTYPLGKRESEDFAETMGVYVVYKIYFFSRGQIETRPTFGRFSFAPYPLHYDFAKRIFGIEY